MKNISKTTLKVALLGVFALGLGVTATMAQDDDDDRRKRASEIRKVGNFTKIDQQGSSDIIVKIGRKQSVEVKADSRMIGDIETYIEGDALVIKHKDRNRRERRRSSLRGYYGATVYITVPKLEALDSRGSGDAEVTGLKADHFELNQKGSGDVLVNGSCKTGDFSFKGSGDFETDGLKCTKVDLTQRGSGDVEISDFFVKTIVIDSKGSGDFDLEGTCDTMEVDHRASGDFDGRGFKCKSVDLSNEGSGDMRVFASEEISISLNGSGDVDIYGGAKLNKLRTRGSGDIETHN
jgi:hypothetical protein